MEHAVEEAVSALTFEPALNQAVKRIGELARECGDKGREIEKLKQEIAGLKNRHIKVYRGCKKHETTFEGASIVLEYEFEPAVRGSFDEPPSQASASVIRVWIGGHGFSYEVFEPAQVEAWEAECLDAEGGSL